MGTVWNFLIDRVSVGRPWWLIVLPLVLPPLVLLSYKSLSGLGKTRRALAILLRSAVVTLIVLALAEVQAVKKNDKLTTMFLVDVSESIPLDMRRNTLKFVTEAAKKRRKDDLAGVVVFGKAPSVETPPSPTAPNLDQGIESTINPQYTDMASALKLTLATFPEDSARRIVLISDGNENRGNAIEQATAAAKLGVQVDVLPIDYFYNREVLVEKIALPPDVKKGETVNINVVIRASEPTTGTLQVFQRDADNRRAPTPGNENPVPITLERGVNVFTLKQRITETNFYTFTAEFVPTAGSGDQRSLNNSADAFTYARGTAQVLLIEGARGEYAELVKALREKKIEVKVLLAPDVDGGGGVGGDPLPDDIGQLQPYDAVILANVPKEALTETQQKLIEANVHDMGAGLIMLGGPKSFGAGGWANSPIEKALPVDMQIKAMRVQGKSALVMLMHATEIPEGNYWMKVIASEALKTLSPYDYAGLSHFEGQEAWLFTVQTIGNNKTSMLKKIDRMQPGDMPAFDPLLTLSMNGLKKATDAMTRHIIVISDGDPAPASRPVLTALKNNKITVTTVAVAAHGNDNGSLSAMRDLATKTGGRFYNVTNPKSLPRIYQKEARIISKPLIYEQPQPWRPVIARRSEPIVGIPDVLPAITGYVQTSLKESELVEVPIVSPNPPNPERNAILAHWNYGLGRSVAFTSDAGRRWATAWPDWESYAAFWSQVVRWSMRPVDNKNLNLTVRREEGKLKIIVDALGKDNEFLNFLQMQASVLGPDLQPIRVGLKQTAPGRYEGVVDNAEASGNYFVNLGYSGENGLKGIVTSGVSVPYSDEYRELRSNPTTLETIASMTNGQVFSWKKRANNEEIDIQRTAAELDPFRRDAYTTQPRGFSPLWPNLLWLAAILFLGDVAIRRVAPDLDRIKQSVRGLIGRFRGDVVLEPTEYMEKLKGRKAEVNEQLDRNKLASTRFEAPTLPPGTIVDEPLLGGPAPETRARPERPATPRPGPAQPPPTQADSYTNRLLKAKQKVSDELNKRKDNPDKT
jgi:uncharacterized membrane protein